MIAALTSSEQGKYYNVQCMNFSGAAGQIGTTLDGGDVPALYPGNVRRSLCSGTMNATAECLHRFTKIDEVVERVGGPGRGGLKLKIAIISYG